MPNFQSTIQTNQIALGQQDQCTLILQPIASGSTMEALGLMKEHWPGRSFLVRTSSDNS